MRKRITLALAAAMILLIHGKAAEDRCASISAYLLSDGFDAQAAESFGANENGMKKYVIAFLKRGPNRPTDPKKAEELQAAHMKNINRMAAEGKLVLAGPFMEDGDLRGIYIFSVATLAEAEELAKTDPAVRAGSLVMELKGWYGSAALMAINGIHKKLTRGK
jgi:uncharacterized protein YciI